MHPASEPRYSRAVSACRRTVLVFVIGMHGAACGNDLDALLGDASPQDAGPTEKPRPTDPYDQALQLFDSADECIACMEAECADEASACADDADCAEELDCRSKCDDAACAIACWDPYPIDQTPTLALTICGKRCATECAVGRHWACAGRYAWPDLSEMDDEVVKLQINESLGSTPLEGIRARVCEHRDADCESPLGDAVESDAAGMITLHLPPGDQAGRSGKQPFDGYIELRETSAEPTHMTQLLYLPTPGWSNTYPYKVPFLTHEVFAATQLVSGTDGDPDRGAILSTFYDCQIFPSEVYGAGVSLTTSNADDKTRTFYPMDPSATETGFLGTAITSGAEGLTTVTGRFGGKVIAERTVRVRGGGLQTVTQVWSAPAATD